MKNDIYERLNYSDNLEDIKDTDIQRIKDIHINDVRKNNIINNIRKKTEKMNDSNMDNNLIAPNISNLKSIGNYRSRKKRKSIIKSFVSIVAVLILIVAVDYKRSGTIYSMISNTINSIEISLSKMFNLGEDSDKNNSVYDGNAISIGDYKVKPANILVDNNKLYLSTLVEAPLVENFLYEIELNGIYIEINGNLINAGGISRGQRFIKNTNDKKQIFIDNLEYDLKGNIDKKINSIKVSYSGINVVKLDKDKIKKTYQEYIKGGISDEEFNKIMGDKYEKMKIKNDIINKNMVFDIRPNNVDIRNSTKVIDKKYNLSLKNDRVEVEKIYINNIGIQVKLHYFFENLRDKKEIIPIVENDKGEKMVLAAGIGNGKGTNDLEYIMRTGELNQDITMKQFLDSDNIKIHFYIASVDTEFEKLFENGKYNKEDIKNELENINKNNCLTYDFTNIVTQDKINNLINASHEMGEPIVVTNMNKSTGL